MYWNLIWKSPGFFQFGVQSDPLWSQTYHPCILLLWYTNQAEAAAILLPSFSELTHVDTLGVDKSSTWQLSVRQSPLHNSPLTHWDVATTHNYWETETLRPATIEIGINGNYFLTASHHCAYVKGLTSFRQENAPLVPLSIAGAPRTRPASLVLNSTILDKSGHF